MDGDVARYYSQNIEEGRLEHEGSRIEFARTKELLRRFLPPSPARVLDVSGGSGMYSAWPADLGYDVRLIDPVPLPVEQAELETSVIGASSHQLLVARTGARTP